MKIYYLCLQKILVLTLIGAAAGFPRAPADDLDYSHNEEWLAVHASYYLKHSKEIIGTDQDCAICHAEQGAWMPLNINCATSCHTPTTSEAREAAGIRGPRPIKVSNECTGCHSTMFASDPKFGHFPADSGLCASCHQAGPEHLAGKNTKAVSTKTANESCYQCHFRKDDKSQVHPVLQMGDPSCINCHDPHSSGQRYFLKSAKVVDSCTQCHEAPAGKSIHGPILTAKSCVSCHDPHSTTKKHLLNKEGDNLCYSCHNQEIEAVNSSPKRTIPDIYKRMHDLPRQHSGTLGGCSTCHSPHSSANERLLNAAYTTKNYNLYDPKNNPYAICFTCHDETMMSEKNFATNFRNDKATGTKIEQKNLHWFHVVYGGNGETHRGRSCRYCHEPHGAENALGIRDRLALGPGGKPYLPVGFKQSPAGGECANICHSQKSLSYQRLK